MVSMVWCASVDHYQKSVSFSVGVLKNVIDRFFFSFLFCKNDYSLGFFALLDYVLKDLCVQEMVWFSVGWPLIVIFTRAFWKLAKWAKWNPSNEYCNRQPENCIQRISSNYVGNTLAITDRVENETVFSDCDPIRVIRILSFWSSCKTNHWLGTLNKDSI